MKYFGIVFSGLLLLSVALPLSVAAKTPSGLIPCGNVAGTGEACEFSDLVALAQNVIDFLIFKIAAPIAAVMFVYAGFLWVTNGGNESQISQAKGIFWAVFIGFVIALAAWLTINMIVNFFLDPSYSLLTNP
jgi:hypothetical protein